MRSARVRSLLGITTEDLPENDNIHSVREMQRKAKTSIRQNVNEDGNADPNKLPSRYCFFHQLKKQINFSNSSKVFECAKTCSLVTLIFFVFIFL